MKKVNTPEMKKKTKILFFASCLPTHICGTTVHTIKLLFAMYDMLSPCFCIDICVENEIDRLFGVKERCQKARIFSLIELDDKYEIAYIPNHIYSGHPEELAILDNHADKWVMWILDSIYLQYVRDNEIRKKHSFAKQCIDNLDGMIFFSKAAEEDFKYRFPECNNINDTLTKVIPIVGNYSYDANKEYNLELPFEDYVLVIGNTYKHKMIPETIEVIGNTDNNFIVVGTEKECRPYNNVYCYPSGTLSDDMMCNLYARCKMLIFPSIYEGFGLPIIEALGFGKEVIAVDNELNHELEDLCDDFVGHIYYYKGSDEIPNMVETVKRKEKRLDYNSYKRTWNDVAKDVYELLSEVASQPVDEEKLKRRHYGYDLVDSSLYLRHQTLVNIAKADYSKVKCDKVIDIYGAGVNGKIFYKNIKDYSEVGCFIDRDRKTLEENISCVGIDEYRYLENHIIVITPEYDINRIKKKLITYDMRFDDLLIGISEFLDKYIT